MRKTSISTLVAALLLLGGGEAQVASQQAPAAPTEPELVSMDFIAMGPDGRPVKTLTPGDIVLRIGGRERVVHGMQYVELGGGDELIDRGGIIPKPLPQPFGSNLLADAGRIVMLVVNHESISPGRERPARDAAIKFLRSLSPRDRVGVVSVPRGATLVSPTRDHEQVRAALIQVSGQAPQTNAPGLPATARIPGVSASQVATSDRACMTRLTLENLTGILNSFGQEEPKTMVFISGGLSTPTRDAPTDRAPGPCELKSEHFEAVATAARASRAHFYVLQPHELLTDSPSDAFTNVSGSRFSQADEALAGLQNLAGVTNGEFFKLVGSVDPVFMRVASESSGYYIVDFMPEPSERNGLQHRVDIRVTAPDVKLRHHPQVVIARAERKDPRFLTPQDMLRGTRRFRTLPLRAIAYPSKEGDGIAVLAIAEPMDPSVKLTSAAMGLVDSRGGLKQWSAQKADLTGSFIVAKFPASTGSYTLRVAAIDEKGRHGTVEYPFVADLTAAGPVKLSGIALGVSQDGGFEPRMVFAQEPAAVVYVEIYGQLPGPAVRVELAETVDGPAVLSVPATVRDTSTPDRRIAIGALPIGSIFPGDYQVRVIVTNDGRPLGSATRTLRKVQTRDGGSQ